MARVAILAENIYEDLELHYPRLRLIEAGHEVEVIAPKKGETYTSKHGYAVESTMASSEAKADDFDALVIPGGYAPDHMRRDEGMRELTAGMDKAQKPIASICHAGWMLASCCDLKGKSVTSVSAIQDDLKNAGAEWEDSEVVVDGHLITSRQPHDLPAFMKELLKQLS